MYFMAPPLSVVASETNGGRGSGQFWRLRRARPCPGLLAAKRADRAGQIAERVGVDVLLEHEHYVRRAVAEQPRSLAARILGLRIPGRVGYAERAGALLL